MERYEFMVMLILGYIAFRLLRSEIRKTGVSSLSTRVFVTVKLCDIVNPDQQLNAKAIDFAAKFPTVPNVGMRLKFPGSSAFFYLEVDSVEVYSYGFSVHCTKKVFDEEVFEDACDELNQIKLLSEEE